MATTPVSRPGEFHGLYIFYGVIKTQTRLSNFHFHFRSVESDDSSERKIKLLLDQALF